MNFFFSSSIRAKSWAFFACVAMACFALNGCASSSPPDSANNGGGRGGSGASGGRGGRGRGGRRSFDGGGPVPVVVAKVTQKDVPIQVSVVGNVEAYSTVPVIPQTGGILTDVFFHEGDFVKKGQKLFEIDQRPLKASLAQAQANLARDEALLNQVKANLARDTASENYARDEAGRYSKLFDQGIVSKEQGEQYRTNADTLAQSVAADKAAIQSSTAQIAADRANIQSVQVQLGYTTIISPIDGKTGNLMFKYGSVVAPNSTTLTSITEVEPIYVTFAVPESTLADVKRYMAQGKLPVTATTQDGQAAVEHGFLTFVDNNVDMTTGTIKLKGTFPNKQHKLWPGQYVNVVLQLTTRRNAMVVPNQAIQSGQDGTFVYVVSSNNRVAVRPVTTGPRVDNDMVVDTGLEPGETVVTEGQLRLAPDVEVQLRQSPSDNGGGGGRGRGGRQGKGRGKAG